MDRFKPIIGDIDKFAIKNQAEINRIFLRAFNAASMFNFYDKNHSTFILGELTADPSKQLLSFELNSAHEKTQETIKKSLQFIVFILDDVKHQINFSTPIPISKNIIQISTPNLIFKFQHRDFFRLKTPIINGPKILVFNKQDILTHTFQLDDVSLHGFCIRHTEDVSDILKNSENKYELSIYNNIKFNLLIEMRHLEISEQKDKKIYKYGCLIKNPNNRYESVIQKYINEMQRINATR